MPGLYDMYDEQQPRSFTDALASQRNSLVGLGLGMMSAPTMGMAMQGYERGATTDAANARTARAAADAAANRAMHREQMGQQQSQFEKTLGLHQAQFEESKKIKPQIHFAKGIDPDSGDPIETPYLITPDTGSAGGYKVQKISPQAAASMGPALGTPPPAPVTAEPTPQMQEPGQAAAPYVDPTKPYGIGPDVNSTQLAPWQQAGNRRAPGDVANVRKFGEGYGLARGKAEAEGVEK